MKHLSLHQQWILFILALFLLGSLTFRFYYHPRPNSSGEPVKEIVVEVLGEVRQPGIYLFQNPPKLREAIERAGGLKETAQFDDNLFLDDLGNRNSPHRRKRIFSDLSLSPSPLPSPTRGEGEKEWTFTKGTTKDD